MFRVIFDCNLAINAKFYVTQSTSLLWNFITAVFTCMSAGLVKIRTIVESVKDQLKPILSNEQIFGLDLYKVGLAEKIIGYFKEMIASPGATRKALENLVNS